MRVLLIYPPRRIDSYIFPPTSLLYVASAIRTAGHLAQIIDIPYLLEKFPKKYSLLDNTLFDFIFQQEFDLIGLGGVVSTYFFYDDFVKKIRKFKKDVPIVVGGSVGVPIIDVWKKHAPVDFLINGEGEIAIGKLLGYFQGECDIKNVPGLFYLKNGEYQSNPAQTLEDLDSIPYLSYDELDYEYYIDELSRWVEDILPDKGSEKTPKLRLLPLLTSRGCPFSCSFCFHFNTNYRYNSTQYVLGYMRFLKEKYKVNCFYIIDDLFIANRNRTIELCDAIHEADLGVHFVAGGGKPSFASLEMLKSMKRAGFIRFSYGIESGSQKMLDVMNKKTTVEQNLNAIAITRQAGIPVSANIIFGMPGENAQTLDETKRFLIKAQVNTTQYHTAWATAYPGTPLFDYMQEKKIVADTREYLLTVGGIGNYVYNFSDLPVDDLISKVYNIHQDVDIAYYFKKGRYLMSANKFTVKIFKRMIRSFIRLISVMANKKDAEIKAALVKILSLVRRKRWKRSEKLSSLDVEKWVHLTYARRVSKKQAS